MIIVKAMEQALQQANPTLLDLVAFYLKNTADSDLKLAYKDPQKFKKLMSSLFGDYSTRLLELIVIKNIKENLGIMGDFQTLEELIEKLKIMAGEV